MASGWQKGTQKIRPGAGFKTGDFVQEKLRGLPYNDSAYIQQLTIPSRIHISKFTPHESFHPCPIPKKRILVK